MISVAFLSHHDRLDGPYHIAICAVLGCNRLVHTLQNMRLWCHLDGVVRPARAIQVDGLSFKETRERPMQRSYPRYPPTTVD